MEIRLLRFLEDFVKLLLFLSSKPNIASNCIFISVIYQCLELRARDKESNMNSHLTTPDEIAIQGSGVNP